MGDVKVGGGVTQVSDQDNAGVLENRPQAGIAAGQDFGTVAQYSPAAGAEVAAAVGLAAQTQTNTSTQAGFGGGAGGDTDIINSGNNVF